MTNYATMDLTRTQEHRQRVQTELQEAGVSRFGLYRFTSQYIPKVIHENEHVKAAIFGRRKESEGFFGVVEGTLIATDKRVLFIDHRPGYTTVDEISYEVVSGVNATKAGPYASVTLYTKVANYQLSYIKPVCAERFASYIEGHLVEAGGVHEEEQPSNHEAIDSKTHAFLQSHEIGVLSSVDRTGMVSGTTIYYVLHEDRLYFITKTGTQKALNILGNQHVALTTFDEKKLQTVQIQGVVETEQDGQVKKLVSNAIIRSRRYDNGTHLPPVMWLNDGDFITFRITPTRVIYSDYSAM